MAARAPCTYVLRNCPEGGELYAAPCCESRSAPYGRPWRYHRRAVIGDPVAPARSPARIAVLPAALADQIAAGEVVERAASVVKELCENSIDAGARRIDVEIDGGGRRLVKVVDDGCGMTPEEARLALRRHATSKIRSADDLWALSTFGFRGEALPSIAAVARLTLSTKVPGATAGFQLTVEAGLETDSREVGIPAGTQIEIRDLFYNTPARLKFQKTEATEAANVAEAVLRLALAHPEIHFRLRASGRLALDLPVHQQLGERVRAAFARRGAGALHEAWGEEGGHQVRAFLAAPDEASTTARSTFLFVGRRFIRDRALLHALALGYGALLDKGRYPLAALFLDVPGSDLDVNVHPQKLEVRFARAAEVYAAVRHVVGAGVARAPWLSSARAAVGAHSLPPPAHREGQGDQRFAGGGRSSQFYPPRSVPPFEAAEDAGRDLAMPSWSVGDAGPVKAILGSLSYVGQFRGTYLVCEAAGDLVLIDQHAAQERVAFERLRLAHGRREMTARQLLFPVPIDLGSDLRAFSPIDAVALEEFGFEIDAAAAATGRLLLRAVPEMLKDADPKPLLRQVLRQLGGGDDSGEAGIRASRRTERVLDAMACHCVVRDGNTMGRIEAEGLLAQLQGVDLLSHPPHGRTILLRLPISDIERRFGRG